MQCQKMQTDKKVEAGKSIGVSQQRSKYVVYVYNIKSGKSECQIWVITNYLNNVNSYVFL
jgi:hypothetical protein